MVRNPDMGIPERVAALHPAPFLEAVELKVSANGFVASAIAGAYGLPIWARNRTRSTAAERLSLYGAG